MRELFLSCVLTGLFVLFHTTAGALEPVTLVMNTSAGEIVLELYPDAAPVTVENFLKNVDGNHYKNGRFYRVVRLDNQGQNDIQIEVIQGGLGMESDDSPFEAIEHETTQSSGIVHTDGVISMARSERW